jgi:hypothetical protein|tara:strand:+ start:913 stop:1374 length:462 start_codon:yes stop_codon:yes gene_type:complete
MEDIYENDITKRMLNEIRGNDSSNNKSLLTEGQMDEEDLTSAELSEEQKNFRDTVSPRVDFTGFKVYPKNKNVVFSGKFENMGGLEWQFTLEDSNGLYITANNVPFSDDTIATIKKLKGYYDNWADEWAQKLATEYNRGDDENGDEVQQGELA